MDDGSRRFTSDTANACCLIIWSVIAKLADVTIETPAAEVSAVDRNREHVVFQSRYHELLVTDLNI